MSTNRSMFAASMVAAVILASTAAQDQHARLWSSMQLAHVTPHLHHTSPRRQALQPCKHPFLFSASQQRECLWQPRHTSLRARLPFIPAMLDRIRGGNMAEQTPRMTRHDLAKPSREGSSSRQDTNIGSETTSEKLVCAVRSAHFFGVDRLKKWKGFSASAEELKSNLQTCFNLPSSAVVQYFDQDLDEYVDLDADVWCDLLEQKFPKIRIIPGQDAEDIKRSVISSSMEMPQQVTFVSPEDCSQNAADNSGPSSPGAESDSPLSLGRASQTATQSRNTVRSCRQKKINYAESPMSPELSRLEKSKPSSPPPQRVLFRSPGSDEVQQSDVDEDGLISRLRRSKIESDVSHDEEGRPAEEEDDDEWGPQLALELSSPSPFHGISPPSGGWLTGRSSGVSSDATSVGASPTIPAALTPLRDSARVLSALSATAHGTPRAASPTGKAIRFNLSSASPPSTRRAKESEFQTPRPSQAGRVGCSVDAAQGTFQTAKKAPRRQHSAFLTPRHPALLTPRTPATSAPASTPKTPKSGGAFKRQRDELARGLLAELNDAVFQGRIPEDLEIKWNAAYSKTAGMTHFKMRFMPGQDAPTHLAMVELSSKVVDSEARLRSTLAHELCHVAQWVVDHEAKPPHGSAFKSWAERVQAYDPALQVDTCHSYKINYRYLYRCVECGTEYGRHSRSIDTERSTCGSCGGRLHAAQTPRPASGFAAFVQKHFAKARRALAQPLAPEPAHGTVMSLLSKMWAERKEAKLAEPAALSPEHDVEALAVDLMASLSLRS